MRTQEALIGTCDLTKSGGAGVCTKNPRVKCHLKNHTVWLKRYGHFGKVPTSAALMLREHHARDLGALFARVVARNPSPRARSEAMEVALCTTWRVSEKIAAMFLSMVSDGDLADIAPPWSALDSTYFVVIDSNTDLFLHSIGYRGSGTYQARRQFLWSLAREVNLSQLKAGVSNFNPRLVQQAAYWFMSRVNRRAAEVDCWRGGASACLRCPAALRERCPVINVATARS